MPVRVCLARAFATRTPHETPHDWSSTVRNHASIQRRNERRPMNDKNGWRCMRSVSQSGVKNAIQGPKPGFR